jgi:hypothetical protein
MNALQKINARAKQLKKANKNLSHKSAIKKASADYRAGKIGTIKKVTGMKRRIKPNARNEVKQRAQGAGLTIQAATHFIKRDYEDKLGRAEVQLFNAKTKTAKRAIRKRISEYKRQLRKLEK